MKLKKLSAILGLLSMVTLLVHIGYTAYSYLMFFYNPGLKLLTSIPFMILTCLHAICGMAIVFLQSDGTRLDLYPKQNIRTILQRITAALIFPMLILHINSFDLLRSSATNERWLSFSLLMLTQPLFYGVVLTHIAVSLTRAMITLGWISSREKQRAIDRIVLIAGAVIFLIASFAVLRGLLSMFLPKGGAP